MPLLALGHKMALSLLTLMLGSALATKPRATKRDDFRKEEGGHESGCEIMYL